MAVLLGDGSAGSLAESLGFLKVETLAGVSAAWKVVMLVFLKVGLRAAPKDVYWVATKAW